MIEIHSTGLPIRVDLVRVGDTIMLDAGTVFTVDTIIHQRRGWFTIAGDAVSSPIAVTLFEDEIVNFAEPESLEDPGVAMDIFLALKDKGAL